MYLARQVFSVLNILLIRPITSLPLSRPEMYSNPIAVRLVCCALWTVLPLFLLPFSLFPLNARSRSFENNNLGTASVRSRDFIYVESQTQSRE